MAQGFYTWSKTAASNGAADASVNYLEGQAPSSVNDSARAAMARLAEYRDDISGALNAFGTASAYTVTTNQVFSSLAVMIQREITFVVSSATNAAGVTLNVDGLGALPINGADGVAIPAGTMIFGGVYTVSYYSGQFILRGLYGNPFQIPIGACLPYFGASVPANFVLPLGQEVLRVDFAPLFAVLGTRYGAGNGSTTFNLPDCGGRVLITKDQTGTRVTTAGGGIDGGTLGASGGQQNRTLLTANLPAYTPAGSITNGAITSTVSGGIFGSNGSLSGTGTGASSALNGATNIAVTSTQAPSTFTGTAQGGTSTPVQTMLPGIVCNTIMRAF